LLSGKAGSTVSTTHCRVPGLQQVAGYAPFKGSLGFAGMKWYALVTVKKQEIFAPLYQAQRAILISVAIMVFLATAMSFC
jgi:hypothetical protein